MTQHNKKIDQKLGRSHILFTMPGVFIIEQQEENEKRCVLMWIRAN